MKILDLLERIAVALEKLADNTEPVVFLSEPSVPPPPQSWRFDPKSGEFPAEYLGTKVGYVIMTKDAALQVVGKENVLEEYENPEWATNTTGRRIIAKSRRILMVYSPPDTKENNLYIRDGKPFPFVFDGGAAAWQVMDEQDVDGEALDGFHHEPLFVKKSDARVLLTTTDQEAV